jgi:TPR repeat protein
MTRFAVLALIAACAHTTPPPEREFTCGHAAYMSTESGWIRENCAAGDVLACIKAGEACRAPDALPGCDPEHAPPWEASETDYARAAALYERWCRDATPEYNAHRHVDACVALGDFYREGKVVARSEPDARRLYDRACKFGESAGCVRLGELALAAHDSVAAVREFQRGCQRGSSDACVHLAGGRGCAPEWFLNAQPAQRSMCDRLAP